MKLPLRYLLPLGGFAVVLVFLGIGLSLKPREVPSPLIGKPAPAFDLAQLHDPALRLSHTDMIGKVWLLNVWASWCVSCRVEHPVLMDLARTGEVHLLGLNYKDVPDKGVAWLDRNGNPYRLSLVDRDGRIGLDYGVYGVPETFVIDRRGRIRHKVIGPLTRELLDTTVLPLVRELSREG